MKTYQFQCPFCDKKYKIESRFLAHECDEMIRAEEIKTPAGQRAYLYYSEWNAMRGFKVPSEGSFITSTYYKAFQRFGGFIDKVQLPAPKEYIRVMVKKQLMPPLWTDNLAYKHYIDHMDRRMSPIKQAEISINTIFDYCEDNGIDDTGEFFEHIPSNEFLQCIVRRQLSPWILFNSPKFWTYYKDVMTIHGRHTFDGIHSPTDWAERFKKDPKTKAEIKKLVVELDL